MLKLKFIISHPIIPFAITIMLALLIQGTGAPNYIGIIISISVYISIVYLFYYYLRENLSYYLIILAILLIMNYFSYSEERFRDITSFIFILLLISSTNAAIIAITVNYWKEIKEKLKKAFKGKK